MSRAFVRESDQDAVGPLPELEISEHPNFVTAQGLLQIEKRIADLELQRQQARAADDKVLLARIARDWRYWTQRRGSAQVVEPPAALDAVRFGMQVTLGYPDGTQRVFRLVGEDEAEPAQGLLSWVSPLAQQLMGAQEGDVVKLQGREVEVVRIGEQDFTGPVT